MKTALFLWMVLLAFSAHASDPANEKIEKSFKEWFPAAVDVKWYDYARHQEATFKVNQILCRVRYDFDGNLLYSRRDYIEAHLHPFILAKVKGRYNMAVYGVTEIFSGNRTDYHIVLHNGTHWVFVHANEVGEVNQLKKYKKA
jgi:hypothetical protein